MKITPEIKLVADTYISQSRQQKATFSPTSRCRASHGYLLADHVAGWASNSPYQGCLGGRVSAFSLRKKPPVGPNLSSVANRMAIAAASLGARLPI
jgi:hypothetical protein